MGLDQYLDARQYFSKIDFSIPYNRNDRWEISSGYRNIVASLPEGLDKFGESGATISTGVGYWRKFYELHNWIEDFAPDNDASREVHLDREDLQRLRHEIDSGEFSQTYGIGDESETNWYEGHKQYTMKLLDHLLDNPEFEKLDFYYSASY